jgi:hypothetical protein
MFWFAGSFSNCTASAKRVRTVSRLQGISTTDENTNPLSDRKRYIYLKIL